MNSLSHTALFKHVILILLTNLWNLLISPNLPVWDFTYVFKPDLKAELLRVSLLLRTLR